MKDKKRTEILLKFIKRLYSESPNIQKSMDSLMIDIFKEEGVSPKQVFFILFFFAFVFMIMDYSRKNLN